MRKKNVEALGMILGWPAVLAYTFSPRVDELGLLGFVLLLQR